MLFSTYFAPMCHVANRIVQNGDTAKDIVQDVFVRLWTNREKLRITSSLQGYLKQSVINAGIDHQRRAYEQKKIRWDDAVSQLDVSATKTGLEELESTEIKHMVDRAISNLPERCRLVFILSRHEGLTYNQIAEKLEISPKTVENQMSKALKTLRKLLSSVLPLTLIVLAIFNF